MGATGIDPVEASFVPAAILQYYGQISPHLESLERHVDGILKSALEEFSPIAIRSRRKSPSSIYEKLQTGKYGSIYDLDDLIGFVVVLRTRTMIEPAADSLQDANFEVLKSEFADNVSPNDFRYREPKIFIRPNARYLDRHPEVSGLAVEIQFTTVLQYALYNATHDFDYKAVDYRWSRFRAVSQLRAMLELADTMIDEMDKGKQPTSNVVSLSKGLQKEEQVHAILSARFSNQVLASDPRRLVDITLKWISALDWSIQMLDGHLEAYVTKNEDLRSVSVAERVLDCLLSVTGDALIDNYSGFFVVSQESTDFLPALSRIPASRRVDISVS